MRSAHDFLFPHQQAVRPAGPLRRRLVPAQPRRESRAGRPQRRRQDHALPHDRRRGSRRRGRRLGAEEALDRLLPPGRRGDVGPLGARRGDRRQRPGRRPAPRARRRCNHAMSDPAQADDMDRILARFGEVQEEYEHLGGYALEAQAREVLHGLGFEDDRIDGDVGALSGGWKMRVAMARVLLGRPDVLLMDEPTNHLDIESIIWLEAFLKTLPGALLMTSHDREFMNRIVTEDRRDRRRRNHHLLRQLRLLRARARHPRDQPRGRLRAPAGDAGQGTALHRPLRRARRQGRAGAEPGQGAGEDREDRAARSAGSW